MLISTALKGSLLLGIGSAFVSNHIDKVQSLDRRRLKKLAAHYFGPFQVLQKVGPVAYRLDFPAASKLHHVFHVSKLKKKLVQDVILHPSLPPLNPNGSLNPCPSAILAKRIVKRGPAISIEVLVNWHGAPDYDAKWEKYHDLEAGFPQFIHEDKDRLRGRIDTTLHSFTSMAVDQFTSLVCMGVNRCQLLRFRGPRPGLNGISVDVSARVRTSQEVTHLRTAPALC